MTLDHLVATPRVRLQRVALLGQARASFHLSYSTILLTASSIA